MRFDILTIFPEFFDGPLDYGIVRRAREAKIVDLHVHDLREFTRDRHRTVDDRPFGGGEGMVLKPEPIFEAVESVLGINMGDSNEQPAPPPDVAIVLLSAAGKKFHQSTAREFASEQRVILICGRYEGADERVAEQLATHEVSVGDFVLSGGELPAALVVDAVTRLLPGALGNEGSAINESFSPLEEDEAARKLRVKLRDEVSQQLRGSSEGQPGRLDFPHYTRPAEFRGWKVPEILIGGNHEEIRKWRAIAALEKTRRNRPDLL
jgi:tRNA (guanine37-N1)-methyltransferase